LIAAEAGVEKFTLPTVADAVISSPMEPPVTATTFVVTGSKVSVILSVPSCTNIHEPKSRSSPAVAVMALSLVSVTGTFVCANELFVKAKLSAIALVNAISFNGLRLILGFSFSFPRLNTVTQ